MSRKLSKSKGIILLLGILVAGLLFYRIQKNDKNLPAELRPDYGTIANKQFKIAGTVIKYGSNHEGDIDKLLIASDEKEVWLHFPPHMARLVKSVAILNDPVNALVDKKGPPHGPRHENVFELKSLINNKLETNVNLSLIQAPIPREGIKIEIQGIPSFNRNKNTLMLTGKVIKLPPHMAHELLPLINQAKTITVKGYMRDSTDGFLSDSGLPVVRPISVKIDSVIYKIR